MQKKNGDKSKKNIGHLVQKRVGGINKFFRVTSDQSSDGSSDMKVSDEVKDMWNRGNVEKKISVAKVTKLNRNNVDKTAETINVNVDEPNKKKNYKKGAFKSARVNVAKDVVVNTSPSKRYVDKNTYIHDWIQSTQTTGVDDIPQSNNDVGTLCENAVSPPISLPSFQPPVETTTKGAGRCTVMKGVDTGDDPIIISRETSCCETPSTAYWKSFLTSLVVKADTAIGRRLQEFKLTLLDDINLSGDDL